MRGSTKRTLTPRFAAGVLGAVLLTQFAAACLGTGLSAPVVEAVYGGRINWIDVIATGATTSRVFISTESANSMFYADVTHSGGSATFGKFQVLPDFDASHNYGSGINRFSADTGSGYVFIIANNFLYSCSTAASSTTSIAGPGVDDVLVYNGRLLYLSGNQLHFGVIASTGVFTEDAASPVVFSASAPPANRLIVNPLNTRVYIFDDGAPPAIYKSSDAYSVLSAATTFTSVPTSGLTGGINLRTFGIGPDGRVFCGGQYDVEPSHGKYIAYTDDDGTTWSAFYTGVGGTYGSNIATAGTSASYQVYCGAGLSNNKGVAGSWTGMPPPAGSDDSHLNDGATAVDPLNGYVIYVTTDLGIGASIDGGINFKDIVDGIEAVQVHDFDMNAAKTIGWTASKCGIRRVSGYGTAPVWTSSFPNDDGSPYYSVAMDKNDATGNTAYAANLRLYKSTTGGSSWNRLFTVEDYPSLFDFWSYIPAIAVSPSNPDVVIFGVNSPTRGSFRGAIYYSTNATASSPTWTKLDTGVYNTEVKDLLWVAGATGTDTIYVGCEYVSDGTNSSYGVKVITYSGGIFTYDNDMYSNPTSTMPSTLITNFGADDLAIDASTGNVYAVGFNNPDEPRVYMRTAGTTTWGMLATAGLPTSLTTLRAAITVGEPSTGFFAPYVALMEKIYVLGTGGWSVAYSYPVGTEINVLYWDEMMVGTSTGLYSQKAQESSLSPKEGTVGTTLVVSGSGFGTKKPTVKIGKKALKVDVYADTQIDGTVKTPMSPGSYDVVVTPKTKGVTPITIADKFEMKNPLPGKATPSTGVAETSVTLSGSWFTTKPKVSLVSPSKTYKCKVSSPTMDPPTGASSVTFVVPKKTPAGVYDIKVDVSSVGSGTLVGGFTVE